MNHATHAKEQRPIYYIRSRSAQGTSCYFLLRTSRHNYARLLAQKGAIAIDLSHFGEILASGYGTPGPSTRTMIERTYGLRIE